MTAKKSKRPDPKPGRLEDNPAFKRGESDATRGFPPREGSRPYLTGYSSKYAKMGRLDMEWGLTRDQIALMAEADIPTAYTEIGNGRYIPK